MFSCRHYITARAALLLIPSQPALSTHARTDTHKHKHKRRWTYINRYLQTLVQDNICLCLHIFRQITIHHLVPNSPSNSILVHPLHTSLTRTRVDALRHTLTGSLHRPNLLYPEDDVSFSCDILTDDLRCRMTLLSLPVSLATDEPDSMY